MGDDAAPEARRTPLQAGDRAPEFTLPAVDREAVVSLADYRGRTPLLPRPGGNLTGLSNMTEGVSAKWVELLKEVGRPRPRAWPSSGTPGTSRTRACGGRSGGRAGH
jgi:hypothetical protein